MSSLKKIHFLSDTRQNCMKALNDLETLYGQTPLNKADIIVILGGDGFMLRCLHDYYHLKKPFYGLNFGRIGFLLNDYHLNLLHERLAVALTTTLYPLKMSVMCREGNHTAFAINEVSLIRQTRQTAKLQVAINDQVRIPELMADGILLSTPAGSTAYNLSIQGPILPIDSALLALTPISPFRPRRWKGALLKNSHQVCFTVLEADKRPVSATADDTEIRHVTKVTVHEDATRPMHLLFDPHQLQFLSQS